MLVAKYWADARLQHKFSGKEQKEGFPTQVTLRRYGWSDVSREEAELHAQQRVKEAMEQVLADEQKLKKNSWSIKRLEQKIGYAGADGLPIREEIIERHGENVITRNSYGALCLNTPDVAFLDVDDELPRSNLGKMIFIYAALAVIIYCLLSFFFPVSVTGLRGGVVVFIILVVGRAIFGKLFPNASHAIRVEKDTESSKESPIEQALQKFENFSTQRPDWLFNVYRTPAGFRLLFLHQTFDPTDEKLWEAFQELSPDSMYVRMCQLQKCFRARLTPKPWRMGISERIEPRYRTWDIQDADLPERIQWVKHYELHATDYASCHFVKQYGSARADDRAQEVADLHDKWCQASTKLPLA